MARRACTPFTGRSYLYSHVDETWTRRYPYRGTDLWLKARTHGPDVSAGRTFQYLKMGNQKSKSSKEPTQGQAQAQAQGKTPETAPTQAQKDQVQMRAKKGKSKKGRPMSDPGVSGNNVDMNPNFITMNPRDSQVISGKHPTAVTAAQMNPLDGHSEPTADYDDCAVPMTNNTTRDENKNKVETCDESLEQVLSIWPEYKPLKSIEYKPLKANVVSTVQQVYKRLCEQHTSIKELSEEKHEVVQSLKELQEENSAHAQRLNKRDAEVTQLKAEVASLRREMRRQTSELESPRYDSGSPRSALDKSQSDYRWDTTSERDRLSGSDTMDGAHTEKMKSQVKVGIMQPLPLLTMEGVQGSKAALKRTPSALKPVARNSPVAKVEPIYDNTGRNFPAKNDQDLLVKIKRLEMALERERREKELGNSSPTDDMFGVISKGTTLQQQSLTSATARERYVGLAQLAMDKVYHVLSQNLGHVTEHRKYQLLGAVMMQSFEVAGDMVHELRESLAFLLLHPARPDLRQCYAEVGDKMPMSAAPVGGGNKFDFPLKGKGTKKLASRTVAASEVPESLMAQVLLFLGSMSKYADISHMVQEVIDGLCQEYSDCTTASVLNQSTFTNFVEECCRLAYQMNVMVPPLHVSTELNWRFEEKFHVEHYQARVDGVADIDFFIWPILFTKKHGDVLCKGRVVVKNDTYSAS